MVCFVFPHCVDPSLFLGFCFKAEVYVNKSGLQLDRLSLFMLLWLSDLDMRGTTADGTFEPSQPPKTKAFLAFKFNPMTLLWAGVQPAPRAAGSVTRSALLSLDPNMRNFSDKETSADDRRPWVIPCRGSQVAGWLAFLAVKRASVPVWKQKAARISNLNKYNNYPSKMYSFQFCPFCWIRRWICAVSSITEKLQWLQLYSGSVQ